MGKKKIISIEVEGGKATQIPQLNSTLAPLGISVAEIVEKINERTRMFEGMKVPVRVTVDLDTKEYEITVVTPSTTSLLLRAAGAKAPSGDPMHQKIGDISFEEIVKVALIKKPELLAKTIKGAVKTILGSARSIGLLVDGKDPKQVSREVDEGLYNALLEKYGEEWEKTG